MIYGKGALLGIVLTATISILAARKYAKIWDEKEPFSYNAILIMGSFFSSGPEDIMDKPIEIQAEFWDKNSKLMERGAEASSLTMTASHLYDPSFGPRPTKIANFTIPSNSDPNYSIPVVCSAPHDAVPETNLPLILYFYMGGFILGSIEAELPISRWLSREANAVVCSVGYRKAPKYPYPTPINDVVDASIGILEQHVSVSSLLRTGIDFNRVATWGISAGGYMAAQATRRLTERGYQLKCQISMVPMAKPHGGTQSMLKNWNDVWSGPSNVYAWAMFLPGDDGTLANDWRVSLLVDPPEDIIAKLPPAYIQINKRDVLHDEGEMYAMRLQAQGKLIELREYDVSHAAAHPGFNAGSSAEGNTHYAVSILKKYL